MGGADREDDTVGTDEGPARAYVCSCWRFEGGVVSAETELNTGNLVQSCKPSAVMGN